MGTANLGSSGFIEARHRRIGAALACEAPIVAAVLAKKRFVGRTIPLVLTAFALALAGVLVVDQYVEQRQIQTSTQVAESTISTLGAVGVFERALHQFEVAAGDGGTGAWDALEPLQVAQSDLKESMQDFAPHLDGKDRQLWNDLRQKLDALARSALYDDGAHRGSLEPRVRAIEDDLSELTSLIGRHGVAALQRAEQLDSLEGALESGVLLLLAAAVVSLLLGWRRAEARARERDAQIESQLRGALADLDAFAGRVAHDLRSPLTPILAGSQWIERADVTDAVRSHAARIERSARRLGRLIEGLLQFTRASAGAGFGLTRTSVNTAAHETLVDFEEAAVQRGASITTDFGPDAEVTAGPEVIQSIVSNLVENALKYGAKEGAPPRVTLRTRVEDSCCVIDVEDAGPGIPPDLRARMFQPFVRGQTTGAGIGLGLSIVQRLVEAQHGRIEVLEGKGGGALFRVWLPIADAHLPVGVGLAGSAPGAAPSSPST